MFSIFKIVQMLKVVHDFGKLVFLSFTIFTVQSVCESGTNALIACNFPHGKDLSQSLPFSLKPKDAKETELSKQIRRHMFFTLHKQFSIFSLDVGHFFSAQHLSFHVCLHQLADETAAPGPTCAQDAARCMAWIAVCSDSEANQSSNSRKFKSAAIPCSTLFLLAPYI
jgi:hypothetical protein